MTPLRVSKKAVQRSESASRPQSSGQLYTACAPSYFRRCFCSLRNANIERVSRKSQLRLALSGTTGLGAHLSAFCFKRSSNTSRSLNDSRFAGGWNEDRPAAANVEVPLLILPPPVEAGCISEPA